MGQALLTLEVGSIFWGLEIPRIIFHLFFDLYIGGSMKCNETQPYVIHIGINLYDNLWSRKGGKQRKERHLLLVKINSGGFLTFKFLGLSDVQVDILCHT
jgi:hypothetical protein